MASLVGGDRGRKKSGRVLGIEIVNSDVTIELEAEQTVYELVEAACEAWLENVRPDDGDVTAHLWTVKTGEFEFYGPFEGMQTERFDVEEDEQEKQVFAGARGARAAFPAVGTTARFDYDVGSPTDGVFELTYERDAVAGVGYPRVVVPRDETPVPAPLDTQITADVMFPHLSALLFPQEDAPHIGRCVMFRATEDAVAFFEDRSGRNDVLFAPASGHRYRSAADLFRAVDYACERRRRGASLFVFCADPMPAADEQRLDHCRNAEADPFDVMLFLREPVADRDAALANIPFTDTFPNTAAAFQSDRWFEFKPGLRSLKLCQGLLEDRDVVPNTHVLARLSRVHFTNLHALLSAVEGLWPSS